MLCAIVALSSCTTSIILCGSRSTQSSAYSYIISNCLYASISATSDGGSVYISSSSSTLYVNYSVFSCSYSTGSGGGFYFSGTSISIFSTCGSDCTSTTTSSAYNGGQLFYSSSSSTASIIMLSLCRCSNSSLSGTYNAISSNNGQANCQQLNSSFNTLASYGACFVFRYSSYHNVTYSNLLNCTTGTYFMIYFDYFTSAQMNFTNIIGNAMGGTEYGIFYTYSDSSKRYLYLYSCVLINNSGLNLFFANSGGYLTATNCWVTNTTTKIVSGNAITQSCSLATTNTIVPSQWGFRMNNTYCGYALPTDIFSNSFERRHNLMIELSVGIILEV